MMTYTEVRVCLLLQSLLLLLLGAGTLVHSDEIPLIQWDAECDSYQVTTGKYPGVRSIHEQSSTTVAQCRSLCTSRRDCGGFSWKTGNNCYLRNINDHIVDQHLSQNWYWSDTRYTWYSKSCGYDVGATDLSCNSYTDRVYDNQCPHIKLMITNAGWIYDLTATECHRWCGLYTGCRSVTHLRDNSDGSGWCILYETTIRDLLDSGLTGDVIQYTGTSETVTTYDRFCAGEPNTTRTIPEPTTAKTTPEPTTTTTTPEPTTNKTTPEPTTTTTTPEPTTTTTTPEPTTTTTTPEPTTTTTTPEPTTTTTTPEPTTTTTAPEPTITTSTSGTTITTPELMSNNQASCRTTGADVTVTLPSSMRDDDVILYVADSEGTLYDQCKYQFTGQQVADTSGRLTVTVDYLACGAHITDEWLTLNSSLVAALQHSHSEQMFSIYHFYCHVARVNDRLDSEHYILQETEGSKDVISETVIDDVTNDNDVTFTMVVVDVDGVIVADDDLALRITSDPVVPFKVFDCSMVSSVIDNVRVTILDDNGCESNSARSNVTNGWAEITFPVKQIPFVDQVYFSCHVSTCVTGNCAQSECDQSDHHVDVIREVSDVGAGPVQGVTINLLTPHFTIYKS